MINPNHSSDIQASEVAFYPIRGNAGVAGLPTLWLVRGLQVSFLVWWLDLGLAWHLVGCVEVLPSR